MQPTDRVPGQSLPRATELAASAVGRRWRLPPASARVRVLRGEAVPLRDGVVLRADVYRA